MYQGLSYLKTDIHSYESKLVTSVLCNDFFTKDNVMFFLSRIQVNEKVLFLNSDPDLP